MLFSKGDGEQAQTETQDKIEKVTIEEEEKGLN